MLIGLCFLIENMKYPNYIENSLSCDNCLIPSDIFRNPISPRSLNCLFDIYTNYTISVKSSYADI